jgi:molybdopterin-biosynthesis enzyme MoeA-like protein
MSFAEKCNILAIRAACADEWTDVTAEWLAWAKGCDVPENPEARRALGNLLEALGARMQRSTRKQ